MKSAPLVLAAIVLMASAMSSSLHAQTPPGAGCVRLAEQRLANTTIRSAEPVATGSFTPPARTTQSPICRRSAASPARSLRRRTRRFCSKCGCRSRAGTASSPASATAAGPGVISFPQLADQLRRGYAAASTNTGHAGGRRPQRRAVRVREAGAADRLRLSLTPRDGAAREGACRGVLRQASRALLFHRLLLRRLRRPDGGAALPRPTTTASSPACRRTTGRDSWPETSTRRWRCSRMA